MVLAAVCLVQSVVLLSVLAIKVDFSAAVTTFTATGPEAVVRGVAGLGFFGRLLVDILELVVGARHGPLAVEHLVDVGPGDERGAAGAGAAAAAGAGAGVAAGRARAAVVRHSARWAMEAFGSLAHLQPPRDFAACTIPGNPLSCPVYPTVDTTRRPRARVRGLGRAAGVHGAVRRRRGGGAGAKARPRARALTLSRPRGTQCADSLCSSA